MTLKTKTILLPLLILLLIFPITAYAYTINEDFNPPVDDSLGGLLDINDSIGIVNELYEEHVELSSIMELQSQGDFSTPDYPFVMTYVDGDELVVMMHGMAALVGIQYEEEELQIALDSDIPIEIIYGEFVLETSQSRINSWKQYYIDHCSPVQAGYQTVCTLYGDSLRAEGINPDSLAPAPAIVPPTPTLSSSSPCDESSSSLACYYYTRYIDRCLPTSTTFRCNTYATQITTAGYALPTSSGTTTPITPVAAVEKNPTNVVATLNGGVITVTWTSPSYEIDRYKVNPYEDNKRQSRTYVTAESFTYSDTEEGKDYKFKVRAYYEDRQNGRSSSSYVYSNVVSVPVSVPEPVIPDPVVPTLPEILLVSATQELRGGDSIRIFGNNPLQLEGGKATAGLIIDYHNKTSLLTASHAVNGIDLFRVVSLDIDSSSLLLPEIGSTILSDSKVGGGSVTKSDAVLVEVSNESLIPKINEIQTNNGTVKVIAFGGIGDYAQTTEVEISSRYNDGIGHITYSNVTASIGDYVVIEQIAATYPSQPGDSGGPIFKNHGNGTATMLGTVVGGACIIDVNSLRLDARDSYNNCQAVYKIFSPWPNIALELGIN